MLAIPARLRTDSFHRGAEPVQGKPNYQGKPTIKVAMKTCPIAPHRPISRSCIGSGIHPTAGRFDHLEILNEIAMPADHARGFLLPRLVQGGEQPGPDSDAQGGLWMAFG
jgi:hypothetical protein